MKESPTPTIKRTIPVWMHKAYAKGQDLFCKFQDKRNGVQRLMSRLSNWRKCPKCGQGFGIHELSGVAVFFAGTAGANDGLPMCPACCARYRQNMPSNRDHVCPECGFEALNMTDLGSHMVKKHGAERLKPAEFKPVVMTGPGAKDHWQPLTEIMIGLHEDDAMAVSVRHLGAGSIYGPEIVHALRTAADRIERETYASGGQK